MSGGVSTLVGGGEEDPDLPRLEGGRVAVELTVLDEGRPSLVQVGTSDDNHDIV